MNQSLTWLTQYWVYTNNSIQTTFGCSVASIFTLLPSFHICAMQFFCFSMLTFKYLAANLSFHIVNLIRTFKPSSTIVKLLPYSNSHGQPYLNSWDNPFITITNNRGLRTDPWWAPTFLYFFFAKTAVDLSFRSCFNIHCLYRLGHSFLNTKLFHRLP